jgi:hypothetical protein
MTTRRFHLAVNVADLEPARLKELAAQADVKPAKITKPGPVLGVYTMTIDDDLLGAERLRDLLRRHGVETFLHQERVVTETDVAAAPMLVLFVDRAEQGYGGPRYGTEFDLENACENCGTGALPVGDVVLKKGDVPRAGDVFRTYDGELFVSDPVRERLIGEGVGGADFHTVRAAHGGERLPWSQLVAPFVLPPIDTEASGGLPHENGCPACGRDGWFETAKAPLELRYDLSRDEFAEVPDMASTWECIGVSQLREPFSESVFAQPLLLVKPRIVDVLRPMKIRALKFVPIDVVSRPE